MQILYALMHTGGNVGKKNNGQTVHHLKSTILSTRGVGNSDNDKEYRFKSH